MCTHLTNSIEINLLWNFREKSHLNFNIYNNIVCNINCYAIKMLQYRKRLQFHSIVVQPDVSCLVLWSPNINIHILLADLHTISLQWLGEVLWTSGYFNLNFFLTFAFDNAVVLFYPMIWNLHFDKLFITWHDFNHVETRNS